MAGSFRKWTTMSDGYFFDKGERTVRVFSSRGEQEVLVVVARLTPGSLYFRAFLEDGQVRIRNAFTSADVVTYNYTPTMTVWDFLIQFKKFMDKTNPDDRSKDLTMLVNTYSMGEEHWAKPIKIFFGSAEKKARGKQAAVEGPSTAPSSQPSRMRKPAAAASKSKVKKVTAKK